jgi:hypothetical protein
LHRIYLYKEDAKVIKLNATQNDMTITNYMKKLLEEKNIRREKDDRYRLF